MGTPNLRNPRHPQGINSNLRQRSGIGKMLRHMKIGSLALGAFT